MSVASNYIIIFNFVSCLITIKYESDLKYLLFNHLIIGVSSVTIMKEILLNEYENSDVDVTIAKVETSSASGIFLFNYKFTHTLNYFLFHMKDEILKSKINLCIIPPINEDILRLPSVFGSLQIIVPKSLIVGGHYCTLCMEKLEGCDWKATMVGNHTLNEVAIR